VHDISISKASSRATVDLMGAYVINVSLDGEPVVKPSGDGFHTHGGIAVLMPYAGRIKRGEYQFEGESFKLPVGKGGHAIHGFAKDARWKVLKRRGDLVELRSRLRGQGYPGILEATIAYSVGQRSFSTECLVRNMSNRDCPLVVGFHPYFLGDDWRISTSGNVQRYRLQDGYFPTGEREPFSFDGVGPHSNLDDSFRVGGTVRFHSSERELVIGRSRMPYLIVYDGKYAQGKSVAIEPYTGLPDAYNNGIGLRVLKPGQSFSCGYRFGIGRMLG
jgi:aldose 1-epimerase